MLGIVLGSKRLYDWVDDNPGVIAAPLSYVNAPETIAQLDNMVSINSCIAADLYGQVASESARSAARAASLIFSRARPWPAAARRSSA